MADSNVLWIQERYDSRSETFTQTQPGGPALGSRHRTAPFPAFRGSREWKPWKRCPPPRTRPSQKKEYTGGIEDDLPELPVVEDGGLGQTLEELVRQGRSGGSRLLQGNFQTLSSAISRNVNYSLVVIGDLFLTKSKAAQTRMLRDLKVFLSERIRVPVISSDELQEKYFVGGKQLIQFFGLYGPDCRKLLGGLQSPGSDYRLSCRPIRGPSYYRRWP